MNLTLDALAPIARLPFLPWTPERPAAAAHGVTPRVLALGKDKHLSSPKGAAVTVRCVSGSLWITHDHDVRDIVICAGESYTASGADRMLVFGLEASLVTMS